MLLRLHNALMTVAHRGRSAAYRFLSGRHERRMVGIPLTRPGWWELELIPPRAASAAPASTAERSRRVQEHLLCPTCGARYLTPDHGAAARLQQNGRWFNCHRCKKRVRSAESSEPAFSAAL